MLRWDTRTGAAVSYLHWMNRDGPRLASRCSEAHSVKDAKCLEIADQWYVEGGRNVVWVLGQACVRICSGWLVSLWIYMTRPSPRWQISFESPVHQHRRFFALPFYHSQNLRWPLSIWTLFITFNLRVLQVGP